MPSAQSGGARAEPHAGIEGLVINGVVEMIDRPVDALLLRVGRLHATTRSIDFGPVIFADGAAEEPAGDREFLDTEIAFDNPVFKCVLSALSYLRP